jgi:DUF1009 family protein
MGKLGIVAGQGEIVDLGLDLLSGREEELFLVDLTGGAVLRRFPMLRGIVLGVGQVGSILKNFGVEQVDRVLFLGKIDKRLLYKNKKLDLKAVKVLLSLKDFSDDSILEAVVGELKKEGIEVVGQKDVLVDMVPSPGFMGGVEPDAKVMDDVVFGFDKARQVGSLGIGQTVVVKDRSVVAVEAVEGTDEAIRRGGELAGPGTVVVKVKRPSQSSLLDVPTVGLKTLEVMEEVDARALVVEARETLVLRKEEMELFARRAGISLLAVDEEYLAMWSR